MHTKELGGVLSGIAMQMDLLKRDVPGSLQQRVKRVATRSRDAASKMRDVIWSVDASRDTFEDLEERMKAYINEMLYPLNITWKFHSENIPADYFINSITRQQVYLIFKEIITNIAKHSEATEVKVSMTMIDRKGIRVVIKDNGIGFDPQQKSRGDGLRNMSARAQTIGATLISDTEKGVIWTLTVPRVS